VALELRTARSAEVSELVRRGEAAIGVRYERDRARELRCEEISREPLVVVCAGDHPLAGRRVARLARLRDERWLAFPEIPGQRELAAAHVFGVFLALGLGVVAWTPIDSLTAQKRLVEAGLGVALMTASSVVEERAAGTLATIAVGDLDVAMPVFLVTRAGGYLGAAGRALVRLLRDG
jgi:DNA-binding transcriptional LysR family regulator